MLDNLAANEVRVFLWHHKLSRLDIQEYADICVSAEEKGGLSNICDKRFVEKVSVRVILYKLLGKDVRICYNENGAPYLSNKQYYISISHTDGHFALSFSHRKHGIDIERWNSTAKRVSKMFATGQEVAALVDTRTITDEDEKAFCTIWSAKESIYKSHDLEELSFRDGILLEKDTCSNLIAKVSYKEATFHDTIGYRLLPDCVLTICLPASV